ncbi:MAG: ATP-dependent RNA helicase HrpA [Planctomycetota bacterium]
MKALLSDIDALRDALPAAMAWDRRRVRRDLRALRRSVLDGGDADADAAREAIAGLRDRLESSIERREQRASRLPAPDFDLDLPVLEARADIEAAIREHQVVVLCGETGSGKTTQLPKICVNLGRGAAGMIGHTQPRRIAARSVAGRIADELGCELGGLVGYKVRFDEKLGDETAVKVMTDGILLAETQRDRLLERYDTIIVDEAHERSLNIDFLLGFLKRLLPKRRDLRVVITSATIDPERFSRHFEDAPILEVSGRTFPVEMRYEPPQADLTDTRELVRAVVDGVGAACAEGQGDVLVFLPGEREIREVADALGRRKDATRTILPLYSRLSAEEQQRVFRPGGGRRIVLATNVAETSITVPGIRFVVDPGLARLNRYSPRTRVQRLPIEKISRASADQRAGRCGRVGPGVCIRLYAEDDYESRPRFTDPEILRTNLAGAILQMKALGLGSIDDFPLLERPDRRAVHDGLGTLRELGALDEEQRLTKIGRELARLPIDPRIGRILIAGAKENCLNEALVIASALSVQDPRERPFDKKEKADELHEEFDHPDSDFLAFWNLWNFAHDGRSRISTGRLGRLCRDRMLSFTRMREWLDTQRQLRGLMVELGYHVNASDAPYSHVHKAILAGFLGGIGRKGAKREYEGADTKFHVHPGSSLNGGDHEWIVAAELVRTTKLYARTCARVRPTWIEEVAGELCKRSYDHPHYRETTGKVYALERVTLFGMEIIAKRRVDYGRINPKEARELFIHHALVIGQHKSDAKAIRENRELENRLKKLEEKARRRDLVASTERVFTFYEQRIPEEIWTSERFETWRRRTERDAPDALQMAPEDLLLKDVSAITPELYPDRVEVSGAGLPLRYRFEPGESDDGVTAGVPIEALGRMRTSDLDWLVPGLIAERARAMLRGLPKAIRRHIDGNAVSAAFVQSLGDDARDREDSLAEALADFVQRQTGLEVDPAELAAAHVPEHTRPNIRVLDISGTPLAESRDLMELKRRLSGRVRRSLLAADDRWPDRQSITEWDFGTLSEALEITRPGVRVVAYPALVDAGESVRTAMVDHPEAAVAINHRGVRRLLMLAARRELRQQVEKLPVMDGLAATYAVLGASGDLRRDLLTLAADLAFLGDRELPRTREQFDAALGAGLERLGAAADEAASLSDEILARAVRLRSRTEEGGPPAWAAPMADIAEHVLALTPPGFLSGTPLEWLRRLPRYLDADRLRLDKLRNAGLERDERLMRSIAAHADRCRRAIAAGQDALDRCPALAEYRWMCEELRVSTFAQELGTVRPVSDARMERLWRRAIEDAATQVPEAAGVSWSAADETVPA